MNVNEIKEKVISTVMLMLCEYAYIILEWF